MMDRCSSRKDPAMRSRLTSWTVTAVEHHLHTEHTRTRSEEKDIEIYRTLSHGNTSSVSPDDETAAGDGSAVCMWKQA